MIALIIALVSPAFSQNLEGVDEDCYKAATQMQADIAAGKGSYNEQAQQDFLLNYFALAMSFSPLHSAVPLTAGQGFVGLELDAIPALGCNRRLVLNGEKTEDTNKAPVAPRPRVMFQFNDIGPVKAYAGGAYIPPVAVFGTRNVIISLEAGFGLSYDDGMEWGLRYHATLMKTIAEIATPFDSKDPEELDFYMGSTFGVDAIVGYQATKELKPYLALGFIDASTFFYIGDDGVVGNNASPYASFAGSVGAQYSLERLEFGAEFYTAPGVVYTGRIRMGIKI
jgi:hypothetical protein